MEGGGSAENLRVNCKLALLLHIKAPSFYQLTLPTGLRLADGKGPQDLISSLFKAKDSKQCMLLLSPDQMRQFYFLLDYTGERRKGRMEFLPCRGYSAHGTGKGRKDVFI